MYRSSSHQILGAVPSQRRSIADAIAVLQDQTSFGPHDRARIQVGPIGTAVIWDPVGSRGGYAVPFSRSRGFKGRPAESNRLQTFELELLNGAELESNGKVRLRSGLELRSVEFIPFSPKQPSKRQRRLMHAVLSVVQGGSHCYRSVRDGLPPELQEAIPDLWDFDCQKLLGLQFPMLKVLAIDVRTKYPEFRRVSEQYLSNTLAKFGARLPTPRPRGDVAPMLPHSVLYETES
jgi:hypothetical protein